MSVQDISQTMMKAVFPAFDGFALTSTHAATDGIDAKRVLDVAASLLLIVLLSPVLSPCIPRAPWRDWSISCAAAPISW